MKVRLNLATSPLENNRRFTVSAFVIGTVAFIGFVLLSAQAYSVWSSNREFRARQSALQSQVASLVKQRDSLSAYFEQPQTVKLRQRAAYLNALIQERAFPWIKIFMDLERILPEGVRVTDIEPKLAGDTVQLKLIVGAATDEEKLKFLKALESSQEFSHIQLLNETRPTGQNATDRVMLELQAQYSSI